MGITSEIGTEGRPLRWASFCVAEKAIGKFAVILGGLSVNSRSVKAVGKTRYIVCIWRYMYVYIQHIDIYRYRCAILYLSL
jgi:hypothetical protein